MAKRSNKPAEGQTAFTAVVEVTSGLDDVAKPKVDKRAWKDKAKDAIERVIRSRGIDETDVIAGIVGRVIEQVEREGKIGNTDYALQLTTKEVAAHEQANPKGRSLPKAARPIADEVERWLKEHYAFDKRIAPMIMRKYRTRNGEPSRTQWLADVHSAAEWHRFDPMSKNDAYRAHWFNKDTAVAFLIRYHGACDNRNIPLNARSRILNTIVEKSSILMYEGSLQDAEKLINQYMQAIPVIEEAEVAPVVTPAPVTVAAAVPAKVSEPEKVEDLDEWFGPRAEPVTASTPVPPVTRDVTALRDRVNALWAQYPNAAKDDRDKVVAECAGIPGKSLVDIPKSKSDESIYLSIKIGLDKRYRRLATQEEKPMSNNITPAEWTAFQEANFPNTPLYDKKGGPSIFRYLQQQSPMPLERFSDWAGDLHSVKTAVEDALSMEEVTTFNTMDEPEDEEVPEVKAALVAPPAAVVPQTRLTGTEVAPASGMVSSDPVRVYPYERGSIAYRGVRWALSLGVGGTMALAKVLMDEMLAHSDVFEIDPVCFLREAAPVVDSRDIVPQPVTARSVGGIVPTPGSKHEDGFAIRRWKNDKDKPIFQIKYMLSNGQEPASPISISTPSQKEKLESTLAANGIDWPKWELGEWVDTAIYVEWTKDDKGYNDYVFVVPVVDAETA